MNSLSKRVVELDSKKRELLKALLEEQNVDLSRTLILPRKADGGSIPPSFAQERLWFLDRLEPGTPSYNEPFAISLTGRLDIPALVRSINEILKRHDALRTSFSTVEGLPVQIISPQVRLGIPVEDLSHFDGPEREKALRARMTEEAQKPFDLTVAPLLRFFLVYLGKQEHILQLTIHHIISDAWSIQILMQELATLYDAFSSGKPSPLPDLPIQYADFALWQREWLRGEELEQHVAYWRKQLGGTLPVLELATDRPRPAEQTFNGTKLPFDVPAPIAEKLKALSRRQGTTLFMTLLAAFQVLLYRYTGQEDIIVGTPTANRDRSEIRNLIGFFSNILPLRIDLSGNPSFLDLLNRVREVVLEAYAHQDTPFEKLVDALQPVRDPSRTPLFQTAFELQDAPIKPIELPGLRLGAIEVRTGTAKFDLALHTEDMGQGLRGAFEFNTDLFDLSTVERMAGHYVTLLDAIATNPALLISDLSLLSSTERRLLLDEFNNTSRPFPSDLPIHDLFQHQARRNPDAVAIASLEGRLSYGELNRRANQLGHYLRKQGVGRGVLVGILMPRGIDQIVSVLGVLKAGGAYVPLDGSYPMSRLAYMIEDGEVSVLLMKEEMEERMPAYWGRVVRVEEEREEIGRESGEEVESGVSGRDVAYVIYTSGSTGMPKGVMVEHCGLVNLAEAQISTFGMGQGDQVLQFASFSFDASIFEIVMALRAGATLHLATQEKLLPGPELLQLLKENRITNITIPPSVLAMLPEEELPELKTIIVAGEACPADLVSRWGKGRRFFNAYGPTETTVWATVARCLDGGSKPTIGRAIPNAKTYLLDSQMRPVPVGLPGELHIGGAGLARGYLHKPGLTAERFVPDPFSSEPGSRLYKTGDLARYLPGGEIDFLGRVDHQVKVRGFRIEPGEVEAILRQHSDVGEAVVMVKESAAGEKRLVAYITSRADHQPDLKEMAGLLKEKLPDYMIPSDIVVLDAFPRTPNGKLDRKALPEPSRMRPELDEVFVPPQTELEQTIAQIWQEVLSLERVGVQDNFFDLGGHSLLMVQVQSKLQILLNRDIAIIDLFGNPTIKLLAKFFAQSEDHQPAPEKENDLNDKLSAGKDRLKQMLRQRQAEVI